MKNTATRTAAKKTTTATRTSAGRKPTIATSAGEPFGLRMGMSAADLGTDLVSLGAPFLFRPLRVPHPHPAFDLFGLKIAPCRGLAWAKAVGRDINADAAGTQLKAAFAALEADLAGTYGACEKRDDWSDWRKEPLPVDWVAALRAEEVVLAAQWSAQSGASLGHGLAAILLMAEARGVDRGLRLGPVHLRERWGGRREDRQLENPRAVVVAWVAVPASGTAAFPWAPRPAAECRH
jgi:hypothetical protein